MIHVSEVARRWVRDIREFVKEKQFVVCKVMGVEGDHIHLSLKRVRPEQAKSKMGEFKRERKAEKMLELAAKKLGKSLEQAYDEVGHDMQENFGSMTKAFEIAVRDPELFKSKKLDKKWESALIEIAKKSYVEKEYEIKAKLSLACYEPEGLKVIQDALSGSEKSGFVVRYVSAPFYMLSAKGTNSKEIAEKVRAEAERLTKEISQNNGEGSFELLEA
jgi:translation initiation factor 2 subunit 1